MNDKIIIIIYIIVIIQFKPVVDPEQTNIRMLFFSCSSMTKIHRIYALRSSNSTFPKTKWQPERHSNNISSNLHIIYLYMAPKSNKAPKNKLNQIKPNSKQTQKGVQITYHQMNISNICIYQLHIIKNIYHRFSTLPSHH